MNARSDRPEAAVVDEISRLIDESLDAGDCSRTWIEPLADECRLCGREWHGLPDYRCPGPFADREADEPFDWTPQAAQTYLLNFPVLIAGEPDEQETAWNASFVIPESTNVIQVLPTGFDMLDALMSAVLAMLAEVVGIHLCESDFDEAITALQEMTTAARRDRQRREFLRTGIAPHHGYTLTDLQVMREAIWRNAPDYNGQAVQGLQGRGHHDTPGAGYNPRWTVSTGSALCDASASTQEAQQATSTRAARAEDL